jgi:hypothetical protein
VTTFFPAKREDWRVGTGGAEVAVAANSCFFIMSAIRWDRRAGGGVGEPEGGGGGVEGERVESDDS